MPWTRDDAEHLSRRAGFGGSIDDVDRLYALGQAGAIDWLVNYDTVDDPTWLNNTMFPMNASVDVYGPRVNLLYQFYTSTRPLHTKMLWYWHGHFTTSYLACEAFVFRRQMATYRANAMGNFGVFLQAVFKEAAMLFYLNGNNSNKSGPNENYAREVMELYTVGTGVFTEADVKAAARAFTGWGVSWPDASVRFDWNQWDNGPKTILGKTAAFNGDTLSAMLADRPETVKRLTYRLYKYFINETTFNWTELAGYGQKWTATDGDIRAVMTTILNGAMFWDPTNRWVLLKTPLDFAFGLMKRFEIQVDRARMVEVLLGIGGIGYSPFDPVNVSGYRSSAMLTGTSAVLNRFQFASKVTIDWATDATIAKFFVGLIAPVAPAALVATVAAQMGCKPLAANTTLILTSYLGATPIADVDLIQKTREVAYLVACTSEYQLL